MYIRTCVMYQCNKMYIVLVCDRGLDLVDNSWLEGRLSFQPFKDLAFVSRVYYLYIYTYIHMLNIAY